MLRNKGYGKGPMEDEWQCDECGACGEYQGDVKHRMTCSLYDGPTSFSTGTGVLVHTIDVQTGTIENVSEFRVAGGVCLEFDRTSE